MTQLLLAPPVMLSCRIPFSGFYGSQWDDAQDSEVEQLIDHWQECVTYDRDRLDCGLGTHGIPDSIVKDILASDIGEILMGVTDYSAYRHEVAEAYADSFAWWVAEQLQLFNMDIEPCDWIASGKRQVYKLGIPFEYEEMTSPKYYNFETDRLFGKFSETTLSMMYAEVHVTPALTDRVTPLVQAFRDMFTSRSGFCSFYDNDIPDKPLADWDHNELYALLSCWVDQQFDRNSCHSGLESEMWEALYETCSNASSNAIDWDKLKVVIADKVAEYRDELEEAGVDLSTLPLPRCPNTMELPL